MNYILNVPEGKRTFVDELLKGFSFVKARKISADKAERMNDMLDAIKEMKEIEARKKKTRSIRTLLREL